MIFLGILALQLESDQPEYDMDEIDHDWFNKSARILCPNLTHLEYETIIDKLDDASIRTLLSLDEARALFSSSLINNLYLNIVYEFWSQRRVKQVSIDLKYIKFYEYFLTISVFVFSLIKNNLGKIIEITFAH